MSHTTKPDGTIKTRKDNPKLDLNGLFADIRKEKKRIEKGFPWSEIAARLSEKYMKPLDKKWGKRISNEPDPYTDIIFAAMESQGILLD